MKESPMRQMGIPGKSITVPASRLHLGQAKAFSRTDVANGLPAVMMEQINNKALEEK